jgi:hypothetical protein
MQPLQLTAAMQWPERMPRAGLLVVDFQTQLIIADKRVPVLDEQIQHIFGPNLSSQAGVTDAFKAAFCHVRTFLHSLKWIFILFMHAVQQVAKFSFVQSRD